MRPPFGTGRSTALAFTCGIDSFHALWIDRMVLACHNA